MNQNDNGDLIKITGLWKRKSRNGGTYLRGNINQSCALMIFPTKKDGSAGSNGPDYVAYYCPGQSKNGNGGGGGDSAVCRQADDANELTLF